MSPLLFDSDSDLSDPNSSKNIAPIPNNQEQQQITDTQPTPVRADADADRPASSSSEPLLDFPTSTPETTTTDDTDLSQPLRVRLPIVNPDVTRRSRNAFRSYKCTPARLNRLSALRDSRPSATSEPQLPSTSGMAAPPATTTTSTRLSHSSSAVAALQSTPKPPPQASSSSDFSVASDISAIMQVRRNVITGSSDEAANAVRPEPYEACPSHELPLATPPPCPIALNRLLKHQNDAQAASTPSSQELQIIEHPNAVITLSSSTTTTTDDNRRPQQTQRKPQRRKTINTPPRTRTTFKRSPQDADSFRRRSPDLFDTYDEDDSVVSALPRRITSFFAPPRSSFFARLSTQAAAAASASTPLRRETPRVTAAQRRHDESIDIFGDNATFIETPRRPTDLDQLLQTTTTTTTPTTFSRAVHATSATPATSAVLMTVQTAGQDTTNTSATSANVFEITRNDVFPHVIRLHSDSDMSPIKVSQDDERKTQQPQQPSTSRTLHFKLPTPAKENLTDPDLLNTGIIQSSQDVSDEQQQPHECTPRKLTLYERLCRSDPSRQFAGQRRRKTRQQRLLQQRSDDRSRRTKSSAAVDGTTTTDSPVAKRKHRMQKWGSDERSGGSSSTVGKPPAAKASKWTGRRLDDYFTKIPTSTSFSSGCEQPQAENDTVAHANTSKEEKTAPASGPAQSFQLLELTSSDEDLLAV